jgi:hypothetical protein
MSVSNDIGDEVLGSGTPTTPFYDCWHAVLPPLSNPRQFFPKLRAHG